MPVPIGNAAEKEESPPLPPAQGIPVPERALPGHRNLGAGPFVVKFKIGQPHRNEEPTVRAAFPRLVCCQERMVAVDPGASCDGAHCGVF